MVRKLGSGTVVSRQLALCLRAAVLCLGDWHCAYVLLYGPRVLEVDEDSLSAEPQPTIHDVIS